MLAIFIYIAKNVWRTIQKRKALIAYLKSDRKERYEKIHILFDTLDEAEQVVDIMASTPSRLQGLWKRVGCGDYLLADMCLSWAIPLVVWLFDCRYIPT